MASTGRRKRGGDGQYDLDEIKAHIEKRLFIARLPDGTDEAELREVFGEFGTLTECRVVKNKNVGFVGFETWAAAHRALVATDGQKEMSGHSGGQTIACAFAERTSAVGRGGGAYFAKGLDNSRVFVGGLPEDISDSDLRALFAPYGHIEGANLLRANSRKRCGFVNFSIWGEALDAVEALNGSAGKGQHDDEPLTVVIAEPRDTGGAESRAESRGDWQDPDARKRRRRDDDSSDKASPYSKRAEFDRIKVAYLVAMDGDAAPEVCDELHWQLMSLRERAPSAGGRRSSGGNELLGESAPPRHGSSQSAGGSSARRLSPVGAAPSSEARSRPLFRDAANLRENRRDDGSIDDRDAARLFIGGLPLECTDEELRALVNQVPFQTPAKDCELPECRVLPKRGCGYLRFSSWAAAEEALEALNERTVSGWKQPLRAQWSTPRGSSSYGDGGSDYDKGSVPPVGGRGAGSRASYTPRDTPRDTPRAPRARSREDTARSSGRDRDRTPPRSDAGAGSHGRGGGGEIDTHRLFVGQLRKWAEKESIAAVFEPYGRLVDVHVIEDKCVAYITFAHEADAKEALKALDGEVVQGVSHNQGLNVQLAKRRSSQ